MCRAGTWGHGKCPGWGPEKEHRHLRKVLRGIPGGGRGNWEERLLDEEGGFQGCRPKGSRLVEGGQRQIYWEMVRKGPLEGLLERNNVRAVLLEIAEIDVKYV